MQAGDSQFRKKRRCLLVQFEFPSKELNARLHCTQVEVNDNLINLMEDAQEMVFSHNMKANGISRIRVSEEENNTKWCVVSHRWTCCNTSTILCHRQLKLLFRGSFTSIINQTQIVLLQ